MRLIVFASLVLGLSAHGGMIPPATRFHPANCLQRAVAAASFTRVVTTAVEMSVVSYLENASSLFELGKRFDLLSKGYFRGFYPDARTIAALIQNMEALYLRQSPGFFVGMRHPTLRLVSRSVESFEVQVYTSQIYRDSMRRNLVELRGYDYAVYRVQHKDGSHSHIISFRHSDEATPHIADRSDDRPLYNLFIFSNGPEQKPTSVIYSGHHIDHSGEHAEMDGEAFLETLKQRIEFGDLLLAN